MASKTVEYGRNWLLKIAGGNTQIDNLLTTGLNQSTEQRNTTTKDSANSKEFVPTIMASTFPFTCLVTEASSSGNIAALQALRDNQSVIVFAYGPTANGTHKWTGSGYITKLDFDAPFDNNVVGNGEIESTGLVTYGTN